MGAPYKYVRKRIILPIGENQRLNYSSNSEKELYAMFRHIIKIDKKKYYFYSIKWLDIASRDIKI